jgi:hypothetical protein
LRTAARSPRTGGLAGIVKLQLTFDDNRTAHNDVVLRLGDLAWRCDSYYLALDQGLLAKREDAQKVRAVLRALLGNWRRAIEALENRATAYLPYDFSDQSTGWLACELDGRDLVIQHGVSSVAGWSISPSNPPAWAEKPANFRPDGGPWTMPVEDFLTGLDESGQRC